MPNVCHNKFYYVDKQIAGEVMAQIETALKEQ